MAKYLDQDGLSYFWDKINDRLGGKLEAGQIDFALNGDNLVLTVNGTEKTIPITELYDGTIQSVSLEGNKLQITTTKGGPFEVDLSGLNVNDTTATVKVADSFKVTGTPLADIFNKCGITSIDKDMNLQDLLKAWLFNEIYSTPTTTNPSVSISFQNATSTLANKTYEVGDTVTIEGASVATPISLNMTNAKVDGLTYGYKLTADGELVNNNSYNTTTTGSVTKGTISLTYNPQTLDTTSASDNKSFTVTQTPNNYTYTYNNDGITLYAASNLGNVKEESKVTIDGISGNDVLIEDTKTTTFHYNVRYKYYIGTATIDPTNEETLQALKKLDGLSVNNNFLNNSGTTTIANESTIVKTDGNSLYIAIPNGYTLSSIKSSLGADVLGSLGSSTFTYRVVDDYVLYKLPVIGGAVLELKDIKITKNN